MAVPNYGMAPCGRVRVQPASPQLLSAVDNPSSTISGRWIISSSALYLLEQVYKIENYPSLHMRQRLAADLEVSQRQVFARAWPPVRPGSLPPPTFNREICNRGSADLSLTLAVRACDADPGVVPEPAPARPQPHQGVREALSQDGVVGAAPRQCEPLGQGRR